MKILFFSCFLIFSHIAFHAQAVEYFHFPLPEKKVQNSLYNSITFLDSRYDTLNFGRVYSQHYKRKVPLVPSVDMATQLNWLLHFVTDTSAKNDELIFQLLKLEFVELGGEIPAYGYCPIRAFLYSKKGNSYSCLARLDTFLIANVYEDGKEITPSLVKQCASTLSNFLFSSLTRQNESEKLISFYEIRKRDSVEKSGLALYNTSHLKTGVYLSYASFKEQKPDYTLLKALRGFGDVYTLSLENKHGKKMTLRYDEVYAFSINDTAYVSTEFGANPLLKRNGNFYFIAKAQSMAMDETLALSWSLGWSVFGPVGAITAKQLAKNNALAQFEAMVDPFDGSFIWLKKIL